MSAISIVDNLYDSTEKLISDEEIRLPRQKFKSLKLL